MRPGRPGTTALLAVVASLGAVAPSAPSPAPSPAPDPPGWRIVELVSATAGQGPGRGPSVTNQDQAAPVASADGSLVVIQTEATDLVDGPDDNGASDIVVVDRRTRRTELISRSARRAGTGDGASRSPTMSADGRWVAFASEATDLVGGVDDANRSGDVFLHDRSTGRTRLVSSARADARRTADLGSSYPALSADGRFLAFRSAAGNLTAHAPPEGAAAIVLLDRPRATLRTITRSTTGRGSGDGDSDDMSLSADGSRLVFRSESTDLVAGVVDRNGRNDVFLWEAASDRVRLLSHRAGQPSVPASGESQHPVLSGDGSTVAFQSQAPDLLEDPGGTGRGVFVLDLGTGRLVLESLGADGRPVPGALFPALDDDGSRLTFLTDTDQRVTTFLRDRRAATTATIAATSDAGLVAFARPVGREEMLVVADGTDLPGGPAPGRPTQVYLARAEAGHPAQRPAGLGPRLTVALDDPGNAVPSAGPGAVTPPPRSPGGDDRRWPTTWAAPVAAVAVVAGALALVRARRRRRRSHR